MEAEPMMAAPKLGHDRPSSVHMPNIFIDEARQRRYPRPNIAVIIGISTLVLLVAIAVILSLVLSASPSTITAVSTLSTLVTYQYVAVSSDHIYCSKAAKDVLAEHGNAVDAALVALFCNGLMNMHSMGIGGGFLMVAVNRTNAIALDARETAPAASDKILQSNLSTTFGVASIAIPGEIAGYVEAHTKYGSGRITWRRIVEPTLELCRRNFTVSDTLARAFDSLNTTLAKLHPKIFARLLDYATNKTTGKVYAAGEIAPCPPGFLQTLETIAQDPMDFYNGKLAADFMADIADESTEQPNAVVINEEDLKSYRVRWQTPATVSLTNAGVKMYSSPLPGAGPLLGFMLSVFDGYNWTSPEDATKLVNYQRMVETFKFAYAQRTRLGDDVGSDADLTRRAQKLVSRSYADSIRAKIDDFKTHGREFYLSGEVDMWQADNFGTSHVSVVDYQGNAVSATSTINYYFGSGVLGRRTGIIFNNEMDDFASTANLYGLPPSEANRIRAGHRPLSSMCPAVFVSNNPTSKELLVTGAAGGSLITSVTAQVAARVLFWKQSIKEAADQPRLHHQLHPNKLYHEVNAVKSLLEFLKERGHVDQDVARRTVVNSIQRLSNGTLLASADTGRKEASNVAGY